ncbi:DNA/RNA non-specific endonuclease [Roseivirga sp. E12]|uniref:DNA/RNA non-specific endonuclease n=1 Tax=Roseivirga sp. E12 TaxID=2819237 RepID=UPI001ABC0A6C|nr:DNA/RNA non-specific endonuclease [Roseivirga sp. E12]MBO3697031.1 DNA/RNA non-specific endonuclease [Roseivirga sp. E12]
MAKKTASGSRKPPVKRASTRKKPTKGKGTSLGRITLGLLILVVLGYAGLAINEGKLVPEVIENFELPSIQDSEPEGESEPTQVTEEPISSETDAKVELDFEDFDLYFTKAFDFMWPAYSSDQAIIERPYYTLRYNEEHEQAMWVAYKLSADSLKQEKFPRKDNFRRDPRVRTGSAELSDYKGTGYDRGHLAPAADFSYDEFALSQTFYMSNMSPQVASFNRGIWKKLEDQVREWTMEESELYIVTGPILNKEFTTIGSNEVSIPEYYYKIVLDIHKPEIKAIAFLLKNEKSGDALEAFVVSIDQIESLSGLDFFPSMPDDLEDALEGNIEKGSWFD